MAPDVADLPRELYEAAIRAKAADSPAGFAAAPAGAYRRGSGGFVPEPRPGCTVLAQPYPITSLTREAALLQDELGGRCPEFAAVPIATLHLTVADLISRDEYASLAWGEREEFCAKAARILTECYFPEDATGTVAGVGVFPSVVIALVSFTPVVYQALMTAREAVYAGLGLSRLRPFTGHITLGYVEIPADAPADQHVRAEHAVLAARQAHAIATGLNMLWEKNLLDSLIERAQLRKAKITVCMGNPKSPHVLDRLVEEEMRENRPATGRGFIHRNVETLVERLALAGNPSAFKVLLFEHYPTFAVLIFDDKIFVYPYAYQVLGNTSPIFQIWDTGSPEAEFFKAHGERVLSDAVPALDVVRIRQDPGFYSPTWRNAAVFAVPAADTELYRIGSATWGYDIWRRCEIAVPAGYPDLRKHVGEAANFGFHVTLADALYFSSDAEIERIRAELRMLTEEFSPLWLTSFVLADQFQDPSALVLRVSDEGGVLEAIHHELVARMYSLAISSTFKAGTTGNGYLVATRERD
jgi:hypothetical protein